MTYAQYSGKNGEWFRGKEGTLNKNVRNNAGEVIKAGETVVFSGKSGRGGFNLRSVESKIAISGVDYESVDFNFKQYDKRRKN